MTSGSALYCEQGLHDDETVIMLTEAGAAVRRKCRVCGRVDTVTGDELSGRSEPRSRRP